MQSLVSLSSKSPNMWVVLGSPETIPKTLSFNTYNIFMRYFTLFPAKSLKSKIHLYKYSTFQFRWATLWVFNSHMGLLDTTGKHRYTMLGINKLRRKGNGWKAFLLTETISLYQALLCSYLKKWSSLYIAVFFKCEKLIKIFLEIACMHP